jgi:hypothetical protein
MSQHVSLDFVEINERYFNLSFIIVKNRDPKDPWLNFFCRTPWASNVTTPMSFYTLDLGVHGRHTFYPCAPFLLAKDDCSSWLEWEIVPLNNDEEDEVKMLHFINDPTETLADTKLKTRISAHPCIAQWAEQLLQGPAPILGNLNRMEDLVRNTILNSTRPIPNVVSNRIRQDIRDLQQQQPRREERQSRPRSPHNRSNNRSPDRRRSPRRRNSPQQYNTHPVIQPVYGTQQMQPQQLLQPQGMLQPVYTTQQQQPAQQVIPQQLLVQQQQQLNPQQQQWNSGIQTMMSNQPQPGLLYAQQRMNNS